MHHHSEKNMRPLKFSSTSIPTPQTSEDRSKTDIIKDLSQFFQLPDSEATESQCFELVFNEFNCNDIPTSSRIKDLANNFREDLGKLRNSENLSLLHAAFKTRSYTAVSSLCDCEIAIYETDSERNNTFHYAAIYDNQSGAPHLLRFLTNPYHVTSSRNNSQMNILHLACEYSNVETVKLIVSDKGYISIDQFLTSSVRVDGKWFCPLDIALIKGNEEIIYLLLDATNKLAGKSNSIHKSLKSCIYYLVENKNHAFLFSILTKYKAMFQLVISEPLRDGSNLLFIAAAFGWVEFVQLILDMDSKIYHSTMVLEKRYSYHVSPLDIAILNDHRECIGLLIHREDIWNLVPKKECGHIGSVLHFLLIQDRADTLKHLVDTYPQFVKLLFNHTLGVIQRCW